MSVAGLSGAADSPGAYKAKAGPHAVETALADWTDTGRSRTVPVKIYRPGDLDRAKEKSPVLLFSHGLGGSRDNGEYLGRHWASHGYVCVFLQHPGSDTDAWRGKGNAMLALKQAIADPRTFIARMQDVHFAVDQVEKLNKEDAIFKGRLDVDRIGMSGHSFGAHTTLAVSGQVFLPRSKSPEYAEPRIKAAVAMSPGPPKRAQGEALDKAFGQIAIPMFHMTGTLDNSPINDCRAEDRRVPFDHIPGPNQYLVILKDGDHMVFSGHTRAGLLKGGDAGAKDAIFKDLIIQSTTAFWDAHLKQEPAARKWLSEGGFKAVLGENGTWEQKPAK